MKTVWKLSLSYFRERPLRLLLTSFATAAAAVLVLWVVSGYDALMNTFDNYSEEALGRYSFSIAPISTFSQYAPGAIPASAEKYVPEEAVAALRADPAITAADPMWAFRVPIRPSIEEGDEKWKGRGNRRRYPDSRILATEASAPPYDLLEGRWLNLDSQDPEVVISIETSEAFQTGVGDSLLLGNPGEAEKIKVVGIIDSPRVSGWTASVAKQQLHTPGVGGLFVRNQLAKELTGEKPAVSFIGIAMKEGTDLTSFRFGWSHRLSQLSTPSQFQEAYEIEEALDESASAENVAMQARMATLVSMLAALFIIFSTLNMGISERVRQLAILRAVALTRSQVGLLVVIEGLFFGLIGFLIGIGSGHLLMHFAERSAPDLLEDGALIGGYSIALAALCAFGGGLLASLLPAWRAMRIRPLDAMAPPASEGGKGFSWKGLLGGLALLLVYPLIAHGPRHPDDSPFLLYLIIGLAGLAAGTIMLAPTVVRVVDRFGSPLIARLLGVPAPLLASQLSANLSRTITTSVALTVGLGLYTGIQVWGHSMMSGFLPKGWPPEAVIAFKPDGVDEKEAKQIAGFEEIERAYPLVVEQPRLREDLTNSAVRATVTRQDSVVILGISPDALHGEDPFLNFEWVSGNREKAIEQIAAGNGCLVPEHFLREAKLKVGDSFDLVPPEDSAHPVTYTIAGAVKMPGWHWQTKPTGFRTRTHRAAALIIANYQQVSDDFHFARSSHLWLDMQPGSSPRKLMGKIRRNHFKATGEELAIGPIDTDDPHLLFMPLKKIQGMVRSHATAWLWAMSRLPIVILVITTIGVLNALLAAVRSRRWEFGILRATGQSRGTLIRLVTAEGLLIGIVALLLSLVFGILSGWCGAGISRYISFFGGMEPGLIIPWREIIPGLLAVLVLTTLASLWPAIAIGRKKPLDLLQEGRGSF